MGWSGFGKGDLVVAHPIRTASVVTAAAFTLAALGACGQGEVSNNDTGAEGGTPAQIAQLFPDDFKGVCSGATVSRAAAYDPAAGNHKALYFKTYKDDFLDSSTSLPPDWTVLFQPDGDAYAAIDLVACAKRIAAKEVKICDGYEKDDKPTRNKVRWHTATYELSVHEAKSGKKLGQTTLEAASTDCPMLQSFDGESDTVDGYASPSDTVVADFLKRYVAP